MKTNSQKSDSSKQKVEKLTKDNIEKDCQIVMAPSVQIIQMVVNTIATEGLKGYVIDDKNMRFGLTIVADIEDVLKYENVYKIETDAKEKNNTESVQQQP